MESGNPNPVFQDGLLRSLRRRPRHLLKDKRYLPVTPTQRQLLTFCFVFVTSDSAGKNTQTLRSEHPRPGSTCIEGAGSQARTKKEPAYAYSRAPRDLVGFPQWAVGHVPTKAPQGCVLWKGRPGGAGQSGTPRRMAPWCQLQPGWDSCPHVLGLGNDGKCLQMANVVSGSSPPWCSSFFTSSSLSPCCSVLHPPSSDL